MSLLSILFSLVIEHFYESVSQFRDFRWMVSFSNWVKERLSNSEFWNDTLGLIIIVLAPMLACAILFSLLNNALALLGFLFSVAVLVYCLGPVRTHHIAKQYLDAAEHEDEHSMRTYATELLGDHATDDAMENNALICEKMFINTNENILGVFFWFVLLGPMGALMFRMVNVLFIESQLHGNTDSESSEPQQPAETDSTPSDIQHQEFDNSTRMLYAILLWLPVQLTTLTFAITGSFIDTLHEWKNRLANDYLNPLESELTLFRTGMCALQLDPNSHSFDTKTVNEVLALCWRAIIVWVTALALLTLAGLTG